MSTELVALGTGIRVAVEQHGTGQTLVLLHAWGETRAIFAPLIRLLSDHVRIVAPDLRGSGDSDKPTSGYALADAAADVGALLDALEIDRVWLAGTSSGGYVAQQVAVTQPRRVAGLVLIGAPRSLYGLSNPFGSLLSELTDPVGVEQAARLTAAIPLVHPPAKDVLNRLALAATTIPAGVWRAGFDALVEATPPTEVGQITAPTLILWGDRDEVLPRADADRLRDAIARSTLLVYDDTGHLVLLERPEWVARDLLRFLAAHTE